MWQVEFAAAAAAAAVAAAAAAAAAATAAAATAAIVAAAAAATDTVRIRQVVCLYGLPRGYLSAVLAHEAGQVLMARSHFPVLAEAVCEGLCELLAFVWLQVRVARSGTCKRHRGG